MYNTNTANTIGGTQTLSASLGRTISRAVNKSPNGSNGLNANARAKSPCR